MFTALIFITLLAGATPYHYHCSRGSTLKLLKRPIYEFSLNILDRISQETGGHFVFSPLSSWLQLVTLAEGATGSTSMEIWKVTRHHRIKCFQRQLQNILNSMSNELNAYSKRTNVIIIDNFYKVKNEFKNNVEKFNGVKVISLDFREPIIAAEEANTLIESYMGGTITDVVYPSDFNFTVLLLTDVTYFKNDWKYPFNRAYSTIQPFYSEQGKRIGEVKMMNQIAYFNLVKVPSINAMVLEIPCSADDRVVLLVLLPIRGTVSDIFFSLQSIRLMTIFNLYKRTGLQLVNVHLPRFKIISDVDSLPELMYDMGIKSVFYPNLANLTRISQYGVYASLMSQIADIEVVEEGITANFVAEYLVVNKKTTKFVVDRPFAFLVVDKVTEIILFAGSYNSPSVY
ncbi:serine protease inhibitor 77Ba-like [Battus philenor]|uniref:serine protease inhibitor 77Ba-like n=1 Tax=Battus philenor TaxID=42288 RepID=UPI0035CFFB97